jgi:hypothetical protein
MMPVKFTGNLALITGAPTKTRGAAQSGATRQVREESNGQGRGVLVWGVQEV